MFNESLNLLRTHAILPERKNIPLPLGVTTTRRRMIKAQGTSVSKWSRSKAPAGARLIRRPREFSLIIAQALPGVHDTHPKWVKCTQIRKHESRFYRRPEVPLKYPHRANERVTRERVTEEKERAGRLGATISSLTLIFGISASPVTRDIANYSKCSRKLRRRAREREISQIWFETSPSLSSSSSLAPCRCCRYRNMLSRGTDYIGERKCPRISFT